MPERGKRFDALYAKNIDPWGFRTSQYEGEKYRATLDALPRRRYAVGIEAGCSIGELTRLLSFRCDRVIGIDVSQIALAEAAQRNGDRNNILFMRGELPEAWPDAAADLVILSEVLYFLSVGEIAVLARRISSSCPDADCILVNFLGPTSEDLQGAEAAACFIAAMPDVYRRSRARGETYQLDVLSRAVV